MSGRRFEVPDLRRFLAGRWRIERTIEDRGQGTTGRFEGEAEFAPEGDELRYLERGRLLLQAYDGEAFRAYRFAFPAPARAIVRFENAAKFHDLDLSHGHWETTYACGCDLYEGLFISKNREAWHAVWRVKGPRKDHLLATDYVRAPG